MSNQLELMNAYAATADCRATFAVAQVTILEALSDLDAPAASALQAFN